MASSKGSDLRIILLGKSLSDTSRVGNFILGRFVFETEDSLHSAGLQCKRVRGKVMGRSITIINASHLLQQNLSHCQLTLCIKECVSLSAPGPHVIMLVVQPDSFTEADKRRVDEIFSSLSEETHKYTMVLTTKNTEINTSAVQDMEDVLQKIIAECNYRHLNVSESSQATLVGKMEEMVRENKGSLVCEIYEDADSAVDQEMFEQITHQPEYQETKQEPFPTRSPAINFPVLFRNYNMPKSKRIRPKQSSCWKLVLLGIEGIKAQISTILLGKKASPVQTESTVMCVKKGELCGQKIMLVEMPALHNTRLSEQKVMRQTLQCVSVCHPGVHVFFIIISNGSFINDAKAEIQTIQRIFGFRVKDHIIFIINQQSQEEQLDKDLQSEIEACGGRYILYSSKTDDKSLFTFVQNLVKGNRNRQYTMAMYSDAQMETQLQYRSKIKDLQQQVCELKKSNVNQTQDLYNNTDTLRIVLLGKTGVGKSASGNTILGKNVFKEVLSTKSVTTVCQSHSGEISGRQITVIDTPGLFSTNSDNDYTKKEIVKCIGLAAPGPHVFLLVLSITQRFTAEGREAVKIIEKMFGTKSSIYTIVIFTGGDMLQDQTIEQYLEDAGPELNTLLRTCGLRYHVLNNMDKTSNTQVLHLLDKIGSMVKVNGRSCYTNEMFQQAEEALEEEKRRILKERGEEIEREKEELKAKYEAKIEKMRKEMQQQKEKQVEEGRRKEEQIKREMTEREQQLREDFSRRKDDDDMKMKEWREEMNREREETRKQWERQREEYQKQREQEEKERRRKEEEWKKQKIEETERFKRYKEEMKRNKEEELKKLELEYKQMAAGEDRRRKNLEEKIKDAEGSKKKELQDLQLSQQHDWERWRKEEEKTGKEQEENWEKRIAAMEEKWNLDQIRKQKLYEWERQKEKEERDLKEKERNEKEEHERRRIENNYRHKIHKKEKELEVQRERYEMERQKNEEELKKEMEEKLKQLEDFIKQKEDEERKQNEERERIVAYMKEQHKNEQENLKRESEKRARKQAEQEFTAKVEEVKQEGFKGGYEKVKSERTEPGRAVDRFINSCFKKEKKEK